MTQDLEDLTRYDFELHPPSKRSWIWVAFATFTTIAGAVGWWLGGNSTLGIAIVGLSIGVLLRALAAIARERRKGWLFAALEVDVPRGTVAIVERRSTSTDERRTEFFLPEVLEDVVVQTIEIGGEVQSWEVELRTELFYAKFPVSKTRGEALSIAEQVRAAAAKVNAEAGGRTEPPNETDAPSLSVVREEKRSVIRWSHPFPFMTVLRLASHGALLFGATPLLDVWYGLPFGIVAVILGVLFALSSLELRRYRHLSEMLAITPDGVTLENGRNEEISPHDVLDVDVAAIMGGAQISVVELQLKGRLEDDLRTSDLVAGFDSVVDEETVTTAETKGCLAVIWQVLVAYAGAMASAGERWLRAFEGRWLVTMEGGGFRGPRLLALTIRQELARVAQWEPMPPKRERPAADDHAVGTHENLP